MPRAVLFALALAASLPAFASPLDDPNVGDMGFSGPTVGDLGAVYWNPAALGLLRGVELTFSGSYAKNTVRVSRAPVDPITGASPGPLASPSATGTGTLHPVRWPPGPGGYFAIGAGLEKRFAIAFALYSPFSSRLSFPVSPLGDEPTRYHLRQMVMDHTALSAGLAIQATDYLHLGITAGWLFPNISMDFNEPLSAGENPSTDARIHLGNRWSLESALATFSYFFSGGLLVQRGRFAFGLTFTSAPLGTDGAITVPLDYANVGWPRDVPAPVCPDGIRCQSAQMTYRLPWILTTGAHWRLTPRWTLAGTIRYLGTGDHDAIAIRLQGLRPAAEPALPDAIVLGRGFTNAWEARGRVIVEPTSRLRASATVRLATSAVPGDKVNPAAVDGTTVEPLVAAEFTVWKKFKLVASYAYAFMLPVDTGASAFHPQSAAACAESGGAITTAACQDRLHGWARPSAAGTYHQNRHTLGLQGRMGF